MFKKHRFKIISAIAVIGLAFANSGTLVQKSSEMVKELPPIKAFQNIFAPSAPQPDPTTLRSLDLIVGTVTRPITLPQPNNGISDCGTQDVKNTDTLVNITLKYDNKASIVFKLNNTTINKDSNQSTTGTGSTDSSDTYNLSNLLINNQNYVNIDVTAKVNGTSTTTRYNLTINRNIVVTGVSLNKDTLTLKVGEQFTLSAQVSPLDATNKNVTWSSSNTSVVGVVNGSLTANAAGSATITVTTEDGGKQATCVVTVVQPVTGVSLSSTTLNLKVGEQSTLIATVSPQNATNKNITWSSSDSSIVDVLNGNLTAKTAGSATITVTTEDGAKTATCTVTVVQPVSSVSLSDTTLNLNVGDQTSLTATVFPQNATNKNVTWSSSNPSVVGVVNGNLTANAAGSATITVTTEDGEKQSTCTVTVIQPVTGVSLSNSTLTLKIGELYTLTATVSPQNASIKNVTWSSSNSSIIDVVNGNLTANAAGTATIAVTTEDGQKTTSCTVKVVQPDIAKLTLAKLPTQPGIDLTLTTTITTTGSVNPLLYQVWVEDLDGWRLVKNFDMESKITNNSNNNIETQIAITIPKDSLTKDSNYKVHARIKDSVTGIIYAQKTETATCVIAQPKLDKITTNATTEGQANIGDNILLTAYGENIDWFQFSAYNGVTWQIIRDFETTNTFTWNPQKPGNYTIRVSAKNDAGIKANELTIPFDVLFIDDGYTTPYTYFELSNVEVPAELTAGNSTTLKATGIGGESEADRQYNFTIGEPMRTPTITSGYKTAGNTYEWKPMTPGIYQIFTFIKNIDSASYEDGIRKYCKVTRTDSNGVKLDGVKINDVTRNHPENNSYKLGETFTFDVQATGSSSIKYSFWRQEDKGYRLIKDYGSKSETELENHFSWTPTKPGTYTILVRAKDEISGSYEDEKAYTYTITDPDTSDISIRKFEVTGTNRKRTNHVISASAINTKTQTSDTLLYKFIISDKDFGSRTIQEFSTNNNCNWLPKKNGEYTITVWVKDNKSGSYEKKETKKVLVGLQ